MYSIPVRNVHAAYPEALNVVLEYCTQQASRNGPVYVSPWPVATIYERPWERVVFWEERDANPYLHFMEALGFLGAVNSVEFYARYAKNIRNYSDDGLVLAGDYGHRWRAYWDRDQLHWAINRLRADHNDRRVVISMWDPARDPAVADAGGKDVPCNTQVFLGIHSGALCMQVNCRSNDLAWGAYGANAVHFSYLLEYLAAGIGVNMGWMIQNSFNWHIYHDFYVKMMNEREALNSEHRLRTAMTTPASARWNPYGELPNGLMTYSLVNATPLEEWDSELGIFLSGATDQSDGLTDAFLLNVAAPIRDSHAAYRNKDFAEARALVSRCAAEDWRRGCLEWLERRERERNDRKAAAPRHSAA